MSGLKVIGPQKDISHGNYDGFIYFADPSHKDSALKEATRFASPTLSKAVESYATKVAYKAKAASSFSFDLTPEQRVVVATLPEQQQAFEYLSLARSLLEPLGEAKCHKILTDLRGLNFEQQKLLADALSAALVAREFQAPKYGAQNKPEEKQSITLTTVAEDDHTAALEAIATSAWHMGEANNLVRQLVMMAGNDLTCARYRDLAKEKATAAGLTFEYTATPELKKMGAGAFMAVAQGSSHQDAGIAKMSYKPKHAKKKLTLVGKGVVFDTGGTNLKSASSMFGMNDDMHGSAVALALIILAAKEQWPVEVTSYLAISDNLMDNNGYRPNDVVIALNGKSIEIVHTDAEGRMLLADTLTIATKEPADLLLDFATLTGACVAAIGSSYCGAFSNRPQLADTIIAAGRSSGERVWPFPVDEDFGKCLESKIADIKQCRLTGGVDHIEAAYFLKQFLQNDVPWVHIDLASAMRDDGLAHIPTKETGVGVRLGKTLAFEILGIS